MSCILIYYQDGAKFTRPVYSPQEYLALRNSEKQADLVAKAREGDVEAKRKLLQFNYSCIPQTQQTPQPPVGGDIPKGAPLKGCKTSSTSVGMDIDFPLGNQVKC